MKKSKKLSKQSVNLIKIGAMILFITLPFAGFFAGMTYQEMQNNIQPVSYEECTTLPNSRLLENDPATCVTLEGLRFSETSNVPSDKGRAVCEKASGTWIAEHAECEGINQIQCQQAGGTYDDCASDCRHDPDYPNIPCNLMCVSVCTIK